MLVLIIVLLSTALSTLTCRTGNVYVKISKQSGPSSGSEEFVDILNANGILYTTPSQGDNEFRVFEHCLSVTTNNQYTIKLRDTNHDSWTAGSYVMVQSIYGNIVFKNFMTEDSEETYPLSLYMPIMKNQSWKMTSGSVSGDWTQYDFGESGWNQVILGSVTTQLTGTQYFRKQFTGLAAMPAYEMNFNYCYGIIAYVNGAEVYRDNLPDGPVTGSTVAVSGYPTTEFRSVIRSGSEVTNVPCVLAVEVHYFTLIHENHVDFDAYLAILARSVKERTDSCFIYPYDTTVYASGSGGSNVFDWNKQTAYKSTSSTSYITYHMQSPLAFINGLRIWPYTSPKFGPKVVHFEGTKPGATISFTKIITASEMVYEKNTFKTIAGYFHADLFTSYRIYISDSSMNPVFYEAQPLICSWSPPTFIEFDQQSYHFYALSYSIRVKPKVSEFIDCTISPTPTEGLTFDSRHCTLSGIPLSVENTTYTVTSTVNDNEYTGTFSLVITSCDGSLIIAKRSYSTYASREGFTIRDSGNNVIVQVNSYSSQIDERELDYVLCLTSTNNYEVTVSSTTDYWQSASFLYIDGVLSGQDSYETILRVKCDSYLGLPTSYYFNAHYVIKPYETWNYYMDEPYETWFDAETSGWKSGSALGHPGYPSSANQIQMFKKQFTVDSLNNVAGLVVSLKYRHGLIIYLNSHEVFRKGFTGNLTSSTISSTSLSMVRFRQISLPIKSMNNETNPFGDYVTVGQNTIAIALIGASKLGFVSHFDCTVRLMGVPSVSRIWGVKQSQSGIKGNLEAFTNFFHSYSIQQSTCGDNFYQITFDDDRHEWITSVVLKLHYTQKKQKPRNVVIKAKNDEDDEWTILKEVTGMTWSHTATSNRILFINEKSYNQYRLENISTGDPSACDWKLAQIDLRSDITDEDVIVSDSVFTPTIVVALVLIALIALIVVFFMVKNSNDKGLGNIKGKKSVNSGITFSRRITDKKTIKRSLL